MTPPQHGSPRVRQRLRHARLRPGRQRSRRARWRAWTRTRSTGSASRSASRSSTPSSTATRTTSTKRVIVEFSPVPPTEPRELVIRIEDQGEGFEPEDVADPLAPENILKSSGRGIFLIRNFMDEVKHRKVPGGGMEIRMVKKVAPRRAVSIDPRFLATAVEAVVRAGESADRQVRHRHSHRQEGRHRSRHRSRSRSGAHVPRADRRAISRSRRAGRGDGRRSPPAPRIAGCSIRSMAPPTTRTACRSSALRWRSRSTARPRSRPSTIPIAASSSPPSAASERGSTASRLKDIDGSRRCSNRCS